MRWHNLPRGEPRNRGGPRNRGDPTRSRDHPATQAAAASFGMTKPSPKAFPFRGRWRGSAKRAVTDEVVPPRNPRADADAPLGMKSAATACHSERRRSRSRRISKKRANKWTTNILCTSSPIK